jgi:hypothetical protein
MGNIIAKTLNTKTEGNNLLNDGYGSSQSSRSAAPSVPLNITINQPSVPSSFNNDKNIPTLTNELKPVMLQNGGIYSCPTCPPCNLKSEDVYNKNSINPIQTLSGKNIMNNSSAENIKKYFTETQNEDDRVTTTGKNPVQVTISRSTTPSSDGEAKVSTTNITIPTKTIENFKNYKSCSYNSYTIMYFFSVVLIILILLFILTKK